MQLCVYVTLGKGERSCATGRFGTSGMVRRLGSTRKEAMASIIMVSDFMLRQCESNKEKRMDTDLKLKKKCSQKTPLFSMMLIYYTLYFYIIFS